MSSTSRPLAAPSGQFLSRMLTHERLLLFAVGTYFVICMALLVYLQSSAVRAMERAALARALPVALALVRENANPNDPRWITHNARWLDVKAASTPFERRTANLAASQAGTVVHEVAEPPSPESVDIAVADGRGRVLLLREPFDLQIREHSERYEDLYGRASLGGLVAFMLGAVLAEHLQRRRGRVGSVGLPPPSRTRLSTQQIEQDRIRLLWIIGLSLAIFIVDLQVPLGPSIGIAYLAVVLIAQFAHNAAQAWFAAVLGTLLTVLKLAIDERIPDVMWASMANRTLSVYALWTVAVLGRWQRRTSRLQMRAELQAQDAENANLQLQQALERKDAAEAQLRRGQELLATVAKMARIGGWEYDVATMNLSWSDEVYRIYGVVPGNAPSVDLAVSFYDGESRRRVVDSFKAAIEHGTPYDLTLRFVNARGQHRWVRSIGAAEQVSGVTVRITGAFQDITEQHEVQARLDRAMRGTQDGFWEQDVATKQVWLSPRFRHLVGYDTDNLPDGQDVFGRLLHPDDRERFEQARTLHLTEGHLLDLEIRLCLSDGEYRWFRARASTSEELAEHPTLSGSIRDIKAERQAALALQAATTAAAEASRAKGEFLANMSHEIRTPMNGVLGMTELLLDTPLAPAQRQFAETIRGSATSLLAILNDILDFSKIEAGKLTIERMPFDIRKCVADVSAILDPQAAAKGLRFRVNVDAAVPAHVIGDTNRLRQVLLNLCGNAIKFTVKGHVTVEVFPLATQAGRILLSFEVHDTGIGMEPDTIAKLFQPFTQADASTTRHFGGSGLGLSIVRRLVELMGGRISVSSAAGVGSAFTFTLSFETAAEIPAISQRPPAHASLSSVTEQFTGVTVLVVEDNDVNREVARRFLERMGCTAIVVPDGKAALEACGLRDFDLILMDVQMPVMDGVAATRELRRREASADGIRTPIVALTASAMPGELNRCLAAGMDGLLTKPLEVARLHEMLKQYFGNPDAEADAVDSPDDKSADDDIANPHSPSGPPIDMSRLRALIGEDDDFVRELCQAFVSTTGEILPRLEKALATGDRVTLASAAHKLKGGSQSICAERIAGLALALERGAPSRSLQELDATLVELRHAIARCVEYLRDTVH